mgnify:CR=1 FL=1
MLQWYVVSTKTRRERFAQEQLRRRGVHALLPQLADPRRSAPSPLFPGYVLIRIDLEAQYFDVVWTPGVRRFVSFGHSPAVIGDDAIALLLDRLGPEGVLAARPAFQSGDVVRIRRGPLEGLVGILDKPGSGRGRVRVLLEMLRRQTSVELPDHMLERASA